MLMFFPLIFHLFYSYDAANPGKVPGEQIFFAVLKSDRAAYVFFLAAPAKFLVSLVATCPSCLTKSRYGQNHQQGKQSTGKEAIPLRCPTILNFIPMPLRG